MRSKSETYTKLWQLSRRRAELQRTIQLRKKRLSLFEKYDAPRMDEENVSIRRQYLNDLINTDKKAKAEVEGQIDEAARSLVAGADPKAASGVFPQSASVDMFGWQI
jgi:hypothetical protein